MDRLLDTIALLPARRHPGDFTVPGGPAYPQPPHCTRAARRAANPFAAAYRTSFQYSRYSSQASVVKTIRNSTTQTPSR